MELSSTTTRPDSGAVVHALAPADDLAVLVRRLLELLGRVTGLQSTYLTAIDFDHDVQEILFARNVGDLEIPEGLRVDWSDTLCKRALDGGPACTDDVGGIYPDSASARELGIKTYVTVPVQAPGGEVFGTLCGADSRGVEVTTDALAVMETLAQMVALQLVNDAARHALAATNDTLTELAYIDALTGIGNRRAFERDLTGACARASRHDAPVSVVMIDVDRFKTINDALGHAGGDEVLVEIARRLVHQSRAGDMLARPGGDEFVAILVDADADVARVVAERLRSGIADHPIVTTYGELIVTVSIGVATGVEADPQSLLERADVAVYASKSSGRNTVNTAADLDAAIGAV